MPKADPLAVACPRCGAGVGAKCRNHKSRACAPHRQRKPVHVPNVQPIEEYRDSEALRRDIAGAAARRLGDAVAACGWFPDARYGKYTFSDRAGALPDVVRYTCSRPGVPQQRSEELFDTGHERLFPPFVAYYRWNLKPGTLFVNDLPPMDGPPDGDRRTPGGFGLRWEVRWESIEVPAVKSAEDLRAAAEKRRAKVLTKLAAEAEQLAAWKRRNETPSLFPEPVA